VVVLKTQDRQVFGKVIGGVLVDVMYLDSTPRTPANAAGSAMLKYYFSGNLCCLPGQIVTPGVTLAKLAA
jgi:hypothetical protein